MNHDYLTRRPINVTRRWLYFVFYFLASSMFISSTTTAAPKAFSGATPLTWSERLADSEMARRGDSLTWKPDGKAKWDYTAGLFTFALIQLYEQTKNPHYLEFAENTIGSFIASDGEINRYKPQDESLDNIAPGRTVLSLWQITREARYRVAATRLRHQLDAQPRTGDGGFWHKKRYPHQMWLDGLYMAGPFYAEYGKLFDEPADFNDVAKQIRLASEHTYNPRTGLFYHGWDESKSQPWANKVTGTSSNFWGRAMGWYAMAMVDVLDYFPTNHPARPEIIATFQKLCAGVVKYQDPRTGLWWQVVDQGNRKGNYLEATASSMFVYAMAKGIHHGYLPRHYEAAVFKGYRGIIENLIQESGKGQWSLTHCCSVAGLGYGRDGSFQYYISEPMVDNDLKGVGPFILAGIEVQYLISSPGSQAQQIR
jgi:unsaturated rhamnogalacturonyl hydrolase